MIALVAQRIGAGLVLMLIVATVLFAILHWAPGDPVSHLVSPRTPAAAAAELRALWGFDDPLPEQWWRWVRSCATGNWGTSFVFQEPVGRVVARALPATLLLGTAAMLIQLGLGITLGALAALARGRWPDHLIRLVSLVAYSLPSFWLALLAILVFSLHGPELPSSHLNSPGAAEWPWPQRLVDALRHLILPAAVLGVSSAALAIRLARNSLLDVLTQPWMLAARARGASQQAALLRHGLPNAAPALLQLLAVQAPAFLSGSLVVEIVFAWPGLGRITFEALSARDMPLALATTLVACVLTVLCTLMADLLQRWLDPRLRDPELVVR